MVTVIHHPTRLPMGYTLVRLREAGQAPTLKVFCTITGHYVGKGKKGRVYDNARQAAQAAQRSRWMVTYNAYLAA